MKGAFLTAEWRHLAMANYAIDPAILQPRVPMGTELDTWDGVTYVSLVAFRFLNTKLKGFPIPFHRDFEEINLRFYVRRRHSSEWRRGVVFIKEIVPKSAIALVARLAYNEPYVSLPTKHSLQSNGCTRVRYEWLRGDEWQHIEVSAEGVPELPADNSQAQFITEHYWGYTAQRKGSVIEYEVAHPSWRVWAAEDWSIDVDVSGLYGSDFASAMHAEPASVFIAEGSVVAVSNGRELQQSAERCG